MTSHRELASNLRGATATSPGPASTSDEVRRVKYTLLLTAGEAEDLDHLVLRVRRRTGTHVSRSQLIRPLLQLLITDGTVLEQVLQGLGKQPEG